MRTIVILALLPSAVVQAQSATPSTRGQASVAVISVGPEVQVSKAFAQLAHFENLAAGDPDHVGRLVACSTVAHTDLAGQGHHCYVSFDSGKTWTTALEFDEGPRNSDPAAKYGRGDTVFVVNEYIPNPGGRAPAPGGDQNRIDIYRSVDGGKTWKRSATFPFVDREDIVVDRTNGKYGGRVYLHGVSKGYYGPGGPASVLLYRSLDGGNTFLGPVERPTVEGDGLLGASTNVVLSDGTLAFTTFLIKKTRRLTVFEENNPRTGNAQLQFLTSTDGGESLNPWVTVSDVYLGSSGAQFAQLAVDPGSRFFKDRLYIVWPDAASGRVEIRFAYSADKGKTWSAPITINDDRPPVDPTRGPDHGLPNVAVNKDGVVLVTWYDRRESSDNMGWKLYAAASLDGGVTFSPNKPVSTVAHAFNDRTQWPQGAPSVSGGVGRGLPITVGVSVNSWLASGGDTNGVAVGADGVFHAMWIDNRTGVAQLWTAPVTVRGAVEEHGAPELAELDDLTDKLSLEVQSTGYDRSTNTVTVTGKFRNRSTSTVRAPLKARVISMSSQLGVPSVAGAANGVTTTGAILDFSNAIPARGLMPDSATAPQTLTFRLTDVRPLRISRQGGGLPSGLVRFAVRVFGETNVARESR